MRRLDQKVALITGGASGLGKVTAERLASEGASVVITDILGDLGSQTAAACGFAFVEQDVTDEGRWHEVIEEVENRFGRLDILVNNAGIVGPRDAVNPEATRLADWRQIFTVNVESVFLGCRAAIPAMRRGGGGSIINMSSVAGLTATPFGMAYGASKAAVRHITKTVAQHCAEQGLNIRCNSVHPGNVHTPMWDRIAEEMGAGRGISAEAVLDEVRARAPLNTLTMPEDVAAAIAFLASDDAVRMTGTKVIVDAGIVNCDTFHLSARFRTAIAGAR